MPLLKLTWPTPLVLMVLALLFPASAAGQTLDSVRSAGVFKIGYREDAAPYSYRDDRGEATGYVVDLCRHVAESVAKTLDLPALDTEFVAVNARNRFEAVVTGRVHILCGPTTVTLGRRGLVDFSLLTFVDGASVIFQVDGPQNIEELGGKRVGVRAGTTTAAALERTLKAAKLKAALIPVDDHNDGVDGVRTGELAAYFADRSILASLMEKQAQPDSLRLSKRYFTYEPYALALRRGDGEFRLLVDRVLSRLYRSGRVERILFNHFSRRVQPTEILTHLYTLNGLAED